MCSGRIGNAVSCARNASTPVSACPFPFCPAPEERLPRARARFVGIKRRQKVGAKPCGVGRHHAKATRARWYTRHVLPEYVQLCVVAPMEKCTGGAVAESYRCSGVASNLQCLRVHGTRVKENGGVTPMEKRVVTTGCSQRQLGTEWIQRATGIVSARQRALGTANGVSTKKMPFPFPPGCGTSRNARARRNQR